MAGSLFSHTFRLLLLTTSLCLSETQRLTSSRLTPTSTRVTLRGQGDGARAWTSSFVTGGSPGTSGSFRTSVHLNGPTRSLSGRLNPLTNRWSFSPSRSLPPLLSLASPRVSPRLRALPFSPSSRFSVNPSFHGSRPPMTSQQIFNYRLPSVSEVLLQLMSSTRSAASSQASANATSSNPGTQTAGTSLTSGSRTHGGVNATLTSRTSGNGTSLTSGQVVKSDLPSSRTGSSSPSEQTSVSSTSARQRSGLTTSLQQRPLMPSSSGTVNQGATPVSGQASARNLPTGTAPSLTSQAHRRLSTARTAPEIRAESADDLFNILQVLHRQTGTASSPAFNVLQTAGRVVNLLQNQARASARISSQPSGSGRGDDKTSSTSSTGSSQGAGSSESSSRSGLSSASSPNKTNDENNSGPDDSKTNVAENNKSPSSVLLSQGVPILTSTPQGVKVTVLNSASKVIQDLLAGNRLDLATRQVIYSVLDRATSRLAPGKENTFYVVHVDPLLHLLSLRPLSINLTQVLQGTLHQRPASAGTGEGQGTTASSLEPNTGESRTASSSKPGTPEEPTTQEPPKPPQTTPEPPPRPQTTREPLKGPLVSSDAFKFLLNFWANSNFSSETGKQGTNLTGSDAQSPTGLNTSASAFEGLDVPKPSSGTFQNQTVSGEKDEEEKEEMETGGGGERKTTTVATVSAEPTTAHPLLDPLWSSLINNLNTPLNITSDTLNQVLSLLFNGSNTTSVPQQSLNGGSSNSTSSSSSLLSSDVEILRQLTPDSASAGAIFP